MMNTPPLHDAPDANSVEHRLRHIARLMRRDAVRYFQEHLTWRISDASPLLIDLTEQWDLDIEGGLRRLRPPVGWPYLARPARRRRYWRSRSVVIEGSAGRNATLDLNEGTLDVRAWIGSGYCVTMDDMLQLFLSDLIPHTILDVLPGRELSSVVAHPLLARRSYPIIGAWGRPTGTLLVAKAPPIAFNVPWAGR